MIKAGTRAVAIQDVKNGHVRIYGKGEYIGDLVPSEGILADANVRNPCIKLDNGQYAWGFQCWWGAQESYERQFEKGNYKTEEMVELKDAIKPKTETNE